MAAGRPRNPESDRIIKVVSNVKSPDGLPWTIDIPGGLSVAVVGPNASMKSALSQAVTLATGAYADDVAGRDGVKDGGLLLTMAAPDEGGDASLVSDVTTACGHVWHFSVSRVGGVVKKPVWTCDGKAVDAKDAAIASILPVAEVKTVLQSGEAKARPVVLTWMASVAALDRSDIVSKLPAGVWDRYEKVAASLAAAVPFPSPVAELLAVGAWAKKSEAEAKAEVKATEAALAALVPGDAPTEAALTDAAEAVAAATTTLTVAAAAEATARAAAAAAVAAAAASAKRPSRADIGRDLQAAREAAAQWEAAVQTARDDLDRAARDPEYGARPPADTIPGLLQWIEFGANSGVCPCCGTSDDDVDGLSAHMRGDVADYYRDLLAAVGDAVSAHEDAIACLAGWSREVDRLTAAMEDAVAGEEVAAPVAPVAPVAPAAPVPDVAGARASLTAATERQAAMRAAAGAASQRQKLASKIEAKKAEATDVARLTEGVADAVKSLLTMLRSAFSGAVTGHLPTVWTEVGIAADVEIESGGREVCRIGLRGGPRGDALRPALSGAEWETVTMAIAATLADAAARGQRDASPCLRLLIPADRAWDSVTLGGVCRALAKGPWQTILTSTVRPSHKTPTGWVVIETAAAQEAEAAATEATEATEEAVEAAPIDEAASVIDGLFSLDHIDLDGPGERRAIARRLRDFQREKGRVELRRLYATIFGREAPTSMWIDQVIAEIEREIIRRRAGAKPSGQQPLAPLAE